MKVFKYVLILILNIVLINFNSFAVLENFNSENIDNEKVEGVLTEVIEAFGKDTISSEDEVIEKDGLKMRKLNQNTSNEPKFNIKPTSFSSKKYKDASDNTSSEENINSYEEEENYDENIENKDSYEQDNFEF